MPRRWESWRPVRPIVQRKSDVQDVGLVIRDLATLAEVGPVFTAMQSMACPELNLHKCHLFPLWAPITDELLVFVEGVLE
eukprot:7658842-Pyramimonas_sp.AAC.1